MGGWLVGWLVGWFGLLACLLFYSLACVIVCLFLFLIGGFFVV